MDTIDINFDRDVQVSVQVGDTAYYTNDPNGKTIVKIGKITDVLQRRITCEIEPFTVRPSVSSFILFSKDNINNTSALKGYYLETTFKNDATNRVELFSVGTEVFESSN